MAVVRPHIGLDAHLLSPQSTYRGAGVSHYIAHLLRYLPQADAGLRYTAFLSSREIALPVAIRSSISALPTERPLARIGWEQLAAPWVARREGLQLWHALVNVQPLALPCPSVVTIPDLSFIRYPEAFHRSKRLYNRLMVSQTARRAQHILAISQSTKDDIVHYLGIPARKVTVTYMGVDPEFRPLPDRAALADFRRRRDLPERMILSIGTLEPRKNQARLVQAFAHLKRRGLPHHLVLGGGKGWLYEEVFAAVEAEDVRDSVHFPGFVPQDELPWWYNAAELFAYPSLYEGFGLPALEAMACGTPVLVSNVSSLPEVVGEAGIKVAPLQVDEMAEAMHRLLSDAPYREERCAAGLAQAARFSWRQTALETTRVYHSVLNDAVAKS